MMARAPFQVLVLPYRLTAGSPEFAIFRRSDHPGCWQGIAGGGEDAETPLEAARREAEEEAGIDPAGSFLALQTSASIPVTCFAESAGWPADLFVIPEHAFGVDCTNQQIVLSDEHCECLWLPFSQAQERLRYDSNRTAIWELHQRLRGLGPHELPG